MSFHSQSNMLDGCMKPGVLGRYVILRKHLRSVLGQGTRTLHEERHVEHPGPSQGSWV